MKKPLRVLVVDDSALMRKLIPRILEQDNGIEVVGTAMDGHFALRKIEDLSPQVITLDLEMPGLNGIDTLKEIMRRWRLPVIVVSSHSTAGASITLKALVLGAFDFVAKPQDVSACMPQIAAELIRKIRAAAQSRGLQTQFLPGDLIGRQQGHLPTDFAGQGWARALLNAEHRQLRIQAAPFRATSVSCSLRRGTIERRYPHHQAAQEAHQQRPFVAGA